MAQRDALREILAGGGFTEDGLKRLFSVASLAAVPGAPPAVLERTVPADTPEGVLARLFALERPVPETSAFEALGQRAVDCLEAVGLVHRERQTVAGCVGLLPINGMWLAYDRAERRHAGKQDFVLDPGPSSRWVAAMAIRRPVQHTLDLGSGSGYLACLAARHSVRVTASDITRRAVGFSAFNAALNGLDNVECLQGDLYEPVGDRRFDRIVCNAPFVISSSRELACRDGGPGICQRIIREAPLHLTAGGVLQVSCHWPHRRGRDWESDLAAWFEGTGCDAWVLKSGTRDAANYVLLMLDAAGRPAEEQAAEVDRWLEFFRRDRVEAVSAGIVTLRPAGGRRPWFEVRDMPPYDHDAGETIARGMSARAFLAETEDAPVLLAARLARAPEIELRECHRPATEGWQRTEIELRLTRGLRFAARVDPLAAALVGFLNGDRTLLEAAEALASSLDVPVATLLPGLPELARRLLKQGLLLSPAETRRARSRGASSPDAPSPPAAQ